MDANRPRVVCVDDEPHVVGGLALHLRRRYDVEVATSASAALELLARTPEAAAVISDMRMPGMNGAEFLARASQLHPNTTRVLLTGYAEIDSAIRAINEGNVFRFLIKPCPPPDLVRTVEAAVELHRLKRVERDLLEQTLHGSIKLLTEVLSVTSPLAFGRATRVRGIVAEMLDDLREEERWQTEVAAMLSQITAMTLPNETAEKLYYGAALTADEQLMVNRAPDLTEQLLKCIPRLEPVRGILAACASEGEPAAEADGAGADRVLRRGAQVLKLALAYDALEAQGTSPREALISLRASERYDPEALDTLERVRGSRANEAIIRDVSLAALKPGMVLGGDVRLTNGTLFVARGYEVTENLLERLRNVRHGSIREPIRVVIRSGAA